MDNVERELKLAEDVILEQIGFLRRRKLLCKTVFFSTCL